MLGVLVNVAAVVFGTLLGCLFSKGIPEKISKIVMEGIGLCTSVIGIGGALKTDHTLLMILAVVCGAIVGTALDLDGLLIRCGAWVQTKLTGNKPSGKKKDALAKGFVSGTLLFCIGAMAIVGSLQSGLNGDHTMLFTKSLIDGISAMIFAVTMGIGVALSAVSVLLYQGAIVLLAGVLAPYLNDALIADLGAVGSLMILAIGLNILGITKLKTANFVPALLFVPLFSLFVNM